MNKRAHGDLSAGGCGHGRRAAGRGAGDRQDEFEGLHARGPAVPWGDEPDHHRDVGGRDGSFREI